MGCKFKLLKIICIRGGMTLCIATYSIAWAQPASTEITIIAAPPIQAFGFDGASPHELPLSVLTIESATLRDIGAQRVTDALRLDASVSDSYNLPAYWDKLSVRGFALDNRYNFRREGLPISGETIIPMDNKERIDLLKGTSGIQSGTSAPGGLVNYVVKRAPSSAEKTVRDVTLSYGPGNNRWVAADLGGRFGEGAEYGYRFNVAHEDLDPYIRDTKGYRDLVALAMDWRIDKRNRLEWEFEQSHNEQIGVNFYSLLGTGSPQNRWVLPATVDGTRNITRQPNSQPGVFDGLTGTMRLKHQLDSGWMWSTQYGSQHLRADDRLTYASGCNDTQKDSFCLSPRGDFQIHDYRSDNEHRQTEVIQTDLDGQAQLGGLEHSMKFSLLRQRQINQMPFSYTDNLVGTTNVNGGLTPTPSNGTYRQTDSHDHHTELAVNDRVRLTELTNAWLGLRHIQLSRQSAQTDGAYAVQDTRSVNTSWLALSQQITTHHLMYASYGQGLETETTPNKDSYTNAGQPLPALRSTQREIGIKSQSMRTNWQLTWFDITRPATTDAVASCNANPVPSCLYTRQIDGQAHHQGLEFSSHSSLKGWDFSGSAMWMDAKRENATVQADLNGQRPINVPQYILRGMTEYRYANVTGLRSGLRLSREGERNATEHGEVVIPAWTTLDATTHYDTKIYNNESTWTIAINNLANKHYWRESPKQYGQYFLYPGAPRTIRATIQFHL